MFHECKCLESNLVNRKIKQCIVTRYTWKRVSLSCGCPAAAWPCSDRASCHTADPSPTKDSLIGQKLSERLAEGSPLLIGSNRALWENCVRTAASGSIFKGSAAAGSAEEILQEVPVHLPESSRLCHSGQVIDTEFEAELFQVLRRKDQREGKS